MDAPLPWCRHQKSPQLSGLAQGPGSTGVEGQAGGLDPRCDRLGAIPTNNAIRAKGIDFNPATGLAERWHPRPAEFPHVVLDPRISFGQPCIEQFRMPTATLFHAWKTEDGDYDVVSDWYEVDRPFVEEVVNFEMALAA